MSLRVACSRGKGSCKDLADVFERAMLELSNYYSVATELYAPSQTNPSPFSTLEQFDDLEYVEEDISQEILRCENFLVEQAAQGTHVVFQTAIDTPPLRLVRQRLQAVRVEHFDQGSNSLLVVRDGFHNDSTRHEISHGNGLHSYNLSKELTDRIVAFAIDRARHLWGDAALHSLSIVYGSHSFSRILDAWAKEWCNKHRIKINVINPDTANRHLSAFGIRGHQLMIAGDEYADILDDILLKLGALDPSGSRCTEIVYLHPDVYPLSEYQISASQEAVDPVSTVWAAASILASHASCKGIEAAMDLAVSSLRRRNILPSDDHGANTHTSTMEMVECILDTVKAASLAPGYMGLLQTLRGSVRASSIVVKENVNKVLDEDGGNGG